MDERAPWTRRRFLGAGLGLAAAACSGDGESAGSDPTTTTGAPDPTTTTTTTAAERTLVASPPWEGPTPFGLGVASGDPDQSSVVLWTRLIVDPLSSDRIEFGEVDLAVDVALDPAFQDLLSSETITARAEEGHSVHHLASGLAPDTWVHYRFRVGTHESPVGRARTTPAATGTPLRFGFSSCQNWESGAYGAHRHLAEADLDLMIWLGDYIYEYGPGNQGVVASAGLREHNSPEITDLEAYRDRYALYRSDPHLQASHAARPWLVIWDDHEIDNDHAGRVPEDDQSEATFLARRRAAHQAWWEHMPVRLPAPTGDVFEIHRRIDWADLASIHMLDGRQYRADQPTDGEPVELPGVGDLGLRRLGPTALDASHSMLGAEQEAWLLDGVTASSATWNVLGNQVYMHGLDAFPGDAPATNTDTWDGYHANRVRLLESLVAADPGNLIVLTGDFHSSTAADLRTDPFDRSLPVVATEFMAPAISSRFPAQLVDLAPLVLGFNPQVRHFDPANGFMTCVVTPESWTTTLHTLVDVTDEQSELREAAVFTVAAGTPGIGTVEVR